jgi:leucyl/phenylalanyl-tRNA--protein transferase
MAIDLALLLRAYRHGVFPMADSRDDADAYWVEPKRRAILPLDGLRISKSLAKVVRQDRFRVTSDTAFADVIAKCAEAQEGRPETWINAGIEDAFIALSEAGLAHSVECWVDDELVGGLYGLAMGRAFFGESMFSRVTDASKVALVWLVARMRIGNFDLLDCQFMTDHLASMGAREISQDAYIALLDQALAGYGDVPDPLIDPHQVSIVASPSPSSAGSSSCSGSGPASGTGRVADWGLADGWLLERRSSSPDWALGSSDGSGSSPGKLILHSFTQTS